MLLFRDEAAYATRLYFQPLTLLRALPAAARALFCRLFDHNKIVVFADVGSPVLACSRCHETWAACLPAASSEDA
jgi:hypothetical protein